MAITLSFIGGIIHRERNLLMATTMRATLLALAFTTSVAAQAPDAPKAHEPRPYAQVVERVAPIYPPSARRQLLEGRVVAWVYVDAEGKVTRVRIRRSPHELLSDAVETAMSKWKFLPAIKDGKPAESIGEYAIDFNLADPDVPLKSEIPPPDAAVVSKYVSSMEAAEQFRTQYWKTDRHKAFASAESGAWGWAAARSSPEQAVQSALETCERVRDRMTSACRIVDIDGQWQASTERSATPLDKLTFFELSYYPRATVEGWPDTKKTRAMGLLEECRAESDTFLEVWKSQDANAIYAAVSQQLRDQYSFTQFQGVLGQMKSYGGAFAQATFKEQTLVARKGDEELRLDQASVVTYLARSVAQPSEILLMVTLAPEAGKCRVIAFQYYAPGALPPWMQDGMGKREMGT
jgi:TonB family protein